MNPHDELRDLWCSQPQPQRKGEDMLALVIERTRTLDRRVAARNALEIAASVLVVAGFAFAATRAPSGLEKLGMAMVAASGAWIAWYVWRNGTAPAAPDRDTDLHSYENLLLDNYNHQIRLLKNVKYWYVMPPYVGLLVAWVGRAVRVGWHQIGWGDYLNLAVFTTVFGLVWILNEVGAVRHLERVKREISESADDGRSAR